MGEEQPVSWFDQFVHLIFISDLCILWSFFCFTLLLVFSLFLFFKVGLNVLLIFITSSMQGHANTHTLFRIGKTPGCVSGERVIIAKYLSKSHAHHHLINTQVNTVIYHDSRLVFASDISAEECVPPCELFWMMICIKCHGIECTHTLEASFF